MKFPTTTSASSILLLLLPLTTARITGFAIPSTIAPDADIPITIITEGFSQSVSDVAISFGISPAKASTPGTLGTFLSTKVLGPDSSNASDNITHIVHVPSTQKKGHVVVQAAWFGLTGAGNSPAFTVYTADVKVGKQVSSDLVGSKFVKNACE